jgi:hypothetical protein
VIGDRFEKLIKEDEAMSGPLNSKKINQRFADFRKKLDIWKER